MKVKSYCPFALSAAGETCGCWMVCISCVYRSRCFRFPCLGWEDYGSLNLARKTSFRPGINPQPRKQKSHQHLAHLRRAYAPVSVSVSVSYLISHLSLFISSSLHHDASPSPSPSPSASRLPRPHSTASPQASPRTSAASLRRWRRLSRQPLPRANSSRSKALRPASRPGTAALQVQAWRTSGLGRWRWVGPEHG